MLSTTEQNIETTATSPSGKPSRIVGRRVTVTFDGAASQQGKTPGTEATGLHRQQR
jgi:hypothetical protein